MGRDFIKEMGYRALDNRLKRISDRMSHDTRKFFKQIDFDIEPSWHLVFKLLRANESQTMVEIADQLGYSHPSTVVMLKKMASKGYIVSSRDTVDKRKQNIRLTQKSLELMPELEQIWAACECAIHQLLDEDTSVIRYLDQMEAALKKVSLDERFYKEYDKIHNDDVKGKR